ncbi:MAG: DUF86 domain-containing protein [Colwellia sp.]|nr:DUF86 domain-containing protein [Colwellia sp.]
MNNEGIQLYLIEATKHSKQYLIELDELKVDLLAKNFKSRDYRATERVLQVFTELCIGLAKHCLKKVHGSTSSDAYQTFKLLTEHGNITSEELIRWRKIIGMRNGLVHDYLTIDLLIVEAVIKNGQYQYLGEFSKKAISFLKEKSS